MMEVGVKTNEDNVFVEILTHEFEPVATACLSVSETDRLITLLQNAKSIAQHVVDENRRVRAFKLLSGVQQIRALEAVSSDLCTEYPE